jgi:hypothetical protein
MLDLTFYLFYDLGVPGIYLWYVGGKCILFRAVSVSVSRIIRNNEQQ